MLPKVSIVIPCYNHGRYLPEALSNLEPGDLYYEVLIVNDGSTEKETIDVLETYRAKGYKIIDQVNMGLAAARNTGIASANFELIMLLDADNSIELNFIKNAVLVFESDPSIAVVYSDAEYFGAKTGRWIVGEFNLQRLMISNYIDACAMVRKSVFTELGGYDVKMKEIKSGWEDWEMWLRIALSGKQFRYIPKIGFQYRVGYDSMIDGINSNYEVRNKLMDYIQKKYPSQLGHQYITKFVLQRFKPRPLHFIIKLSMIAWFNGRYRKLLNKNKIIEGI